jgi:hypothetical protein
MGGGEAPGGGGKGGGGLRWGRLFTLLVFLGGGGGAGAYFKVWDRYVPAKIQSMLGFGALASPEKLDREMKSAGQATEKVRTAALGQTVRWTAKVTEVRRPLIGGSPTVVGRAGETLVLVHFPNEADADVKALYIGGEVEFEGRVTKVPPDHELTVEDARVIRKE